MKSVFESVVNAPDREYKSNGFAYPIVLAALLIAISSLTRIALLLNSVTNLDYSFVNITGAFASAFSMI